MNKVDQSGLNLMGVNNDTLPYCDTSCMQHQAPTVHQYLFNIVVQAATTNGSMFTFFAIFSYPLIWKMTHEIFKIMTC